MVLGCAHAYIKTGRVRCPMRAGCVKQVAPVCAFKPGTILPLSAACLVTSPTASHWLTR
jgi:hypothetical protein